MITRHPSSLPLGNGQVAEYLEEIAGLLEAQDANPFRVRAYRTAAETVRALEWPLHELLQSEGSAGLCNLRGIGQSLARSIDQLVHTGHLGLLTRLRGEWRPEDVFATVPGIGHELARRIHEELEIETLTELEAAAYDGRLTRVPGIGRRRVRAVAESLAGRFLRPRIVPARRSEDGPQHPPVSEILDVDSQYLRGAHKDVLPRIAPKRFNPARRAWLPILHTVRHGRHYTALFSNTARAHDLGTTDDWVVIYRDDHDGHGQWTVVTARFGPLLGMRIVRGREAECEAFYRSSRPKTPEPCSPPD